MRSGCSKRWQPASSWRNGTATYGKVHEFCSCHTQDLMQVGSWVLRWGPDRIRCWFHLSFQTIGSFIDALWDIKWKIYPLGSLCGSRGPLSSDYWHGKGSFGILRSLNDPQVDGIVSWGPEGWNEQELLFGCCVRFRSPNHHWSPTKACFATKMTNRSVCQRFVRDCDVLCSNFAH